MNKFDIIITSKHKSQKKAWGEKEKLTNIIITDDLIDPLIYLRYNLSSPYLKGLSNYVTVVIHQHHYVMITKAYIHHKYHERYILEIQLEQPIHGPITIYIMNLPERKHEHQGSGCRIIHEHELVKQNSNIFK